MIKCFIRLFLFYDLHAIKRSTFSTFVRFLCKDLGLHLLLNSLHHFHRIHIDLFLPGLVSLSPGKYMTATPALGLICTVNQIDDETTYTILNMPDVSSVQCYFSWTNKTVSGIFTDFCHILFFLSFLTCFNAALKQRLKHTVLKN